MKPLIGISPSAEVDQSYYMTTTDNMKAIEQAGGMPVVMPYATTEQDIAELAGRIDGLYLTGGYDIDPTLFGEEPHPKLGTIIPARDKFEIAMVHKMRELGKPIFGVCRGCQIMNIAVGGDMYQDMYSQIEGNLLQHQQKAPKEHGSHFVFVEENSLLHKLTGENKLTVNSRHHQANRHVPETFQVSGKASDGVIEAVESKEEPFFLGLQWHPENMVAHKDIASEKIYQGFIKACKKSKGGSKNESH